MREQKKLVTLAQTPKLWTQGLRFASPEQHRPTMRKSTAKNKDFTPVLGEKASQKKLKKS